VNLILNAYDEPQKSGIVTEDQKSYSKELISFDEIRRLSEGLPLFSGTKLPKEAYAPVTAKKLSKAKVLWLNFDLLRDEGIPFPKQGLTPYFEKAVLDAFAYSVPQPTDPPELFNEEEKIFYADRYGGEGLEGNWGSGRAASAGRVQIKGIGRTPLVGRHVPDHHSNGGTSKNEAMIEAIWGEINYRELPFGSNQGSRVLAIIDPGTWTKWKDGGCEARALVVRLDPVRPAHFLPKAPTKGDELPEHEELRNVENIRVSAALKLMHRSLACQDLGDGIREFAHRLGVHSATAFARGFYHGTTAPSNREINGGFLDYGTQTAQPGFGQVYVLQEVAPAGLDFEEIKDVNSCFAECFKSYSVVLRNSANVRSPSPTVEELNKISDLGYQETLTRELLYLTGMPIHLVDKYRELPLAKSLADTLLQIARHGCVKICVDKDMPKRVSELDLRRILIKMAEVHDQNIDTIEASLEEELPDQYSKTFIDQYLSFYRLVKQEAQFDGLSEPGLRGYIIESARLRNRILPDLYRSNLRTTNQKFIDDYQRTGLRTPLWDSINARIRKNAYTFKNVARYQVVVSEFRDPLDNAFLRYLFDANENAEFISLSVPIIDEEVRFKGQFLTVSQATGANLVLSSANDGKILAATAPLQTNADLTFKIPIPVQAKEPKDLELNLIASDGKRLLKIDLKAILAEITEFRTPLPPSSSLLSFKQILNAVAATANAALAKEKVQDDKRKENEIPSDAAANSTQLN